jgi:rod shape-determining protein MreC
MNYYSKFSSSKTNYSILYNFNLVFKKIESFLFIALCVISLITSKVNKKFSQDISFTIVNISLPVVKFIAFPFNSIINLLTDFEELVNAKKENKLLKEDLEKLRSFYISSLNIHQENKELRNILQFITTKTSNFKVAKIIARSHQVFNQKLLIDAGKNRGLKEGSVVVGSRGMIGRITDVGDNRSSLMLLTDANSRIPVITSKARARGILSGSNSELIEIIYLPKNHNIQIGDWVFTSGDGDTLAPGILVGVVNKVEKDSVFVVMAEDISNAEIITIMDF